MHCIAVINQKGGCGKTTVSINFAACLAAHNHRTLLVDMDPQGHCAVGLAVPDEQIERNIYDVLVSARQDGQTKLKNIVWQIAQNFDLAPAGIELAALEPQLTGQENTDECLKDLLAQEAQEYDFVVLDCPPSVGLLTFNALRAADQVIIPVETGYFALHGLARQLETLEVLTRQCKQHLDIKVLASMYDVRTKLAREVLSELRKHYRDKMFETVINFNTKLKEAASFGQPITEYDSNSKGMHDFNALVTEVVAQATTGPAPDTAARVESELAVIGKTADELLAAINDAAPPRPQRAQQKRQPQEKTIQQKIDNFYGVRPGQGCVEFVALYPQASQVHVAGDFNDWQPASTALSRTDDRGRWSIELPLPAGQYRYRYVVDGRWQEDPHNKHTEVNEFGDHNSVVEVG